MTRNKCDPTFKKISNFWRIAKIPPIFKEAEVLPRRLPNFGNGNNFAFLSIKLPLIHIPLGLKFRREIDHSNFPSAMAGQNNFFPDPSTLTIMITHIQRTSTGPILRIQGDFTSIISAKNSRARRHDRVPLARRLCLSKNQAVLEALRSRVKVIIRRKGKNMTPGAKPTFQGHPTTIFGKISVRKVI